MVKYHFITFATQDHMQFAKDNLKSAIEIGGFDTGKIYTMDDIDEYFKSQNIELFKQKRLAGYAVWKPYIIIHRLLQIDDNDILCYNDSKYIWRTNVRNMEKKLFTSGNNIGVYENRPNSNTHIEKKWTKGDAFTLMNIPLTFANTNSNQVWSGYVLLRRELTSIRFITEWLTYNQDFRIVSDSPTEITKNDNSFIENRHDQTVLSLLCKKWSIHMHTLDATWMIDVINPILEPNAI